MNKLTMLAGAVGLALTSTGTATAADLGPYEAAPAYAAPVHVFSWTGFYAGINAGYGQGRDDVGYTFDPKFFGGRAAAGQVPVSQSIGNQGVLAGVQIGYNWQLGSAGLVGVETDFDWARINGANSSTDVATNNFNTTAERRVDSLGTLRLRLGYLLTPNILLYGTGGLAYGETSLKVSTLNMTSCGTSPGCLSNTATTTRAGWTAGGGYEVAIGHGMSWKTEYLYVDLGSDSATVTSPFGAAGNFYTGSTSFRDNVFRTGINFRFGGRDEVVPIK
jgi:outer membrane immunogenic protein